MTEREYRALEIDSYSSLKDFLNDPKKYYRKYIAKDNVKEKLDDSIILGAIVDKLLTDPDHLDDDFEVSMNNKPTGQMLDFVNKLYDITVECTHNDTVTRAIEDLIKEAFEAVKYNRDGEEVAFKKKDLQYVIEKFYGTNAEEYYNQLRLSSVKYIVNQSDIANAQNIYDGLRMDQFVGPIVRLQSNDRYTVYHQLQILFEVDDYPLKMMADKVVIDHKEKKIYPYDYKCTWMVSRFDMAIWKMKYHFQAALYKTGIQQWASQEGWEEYEVQNLAFIVSDSINYMAPLIYETDDVLYEEAMNGYVDMFGNFNPGVRQCIETLKWHKAKQLWNISKENYENKGRVKIKHLSSAVQQESDE